MQNDFNDNNFKRNSYMPIDAYKVFFWSILGTLLGSFFVALLLNGISSASNINYVELLNNRLVIFFLYLVSPIVFSSLYFLYNKKNKIYQFSELGFKNKFKPINILFCLLVSLVSLFLLEPFVNLLNYGFSIMGYNPSSVIYKMDTIGRLFIGIFISAVLPAIFEELLFRGIILNGLLKKFDVASSIILSALFFMLMHGSLQQTIYQFILGIIFGAVAYYSGSVIYSMLTHFFNNAIVLIINYVMPALLEGKTKYNITDFFISIFFVLVAALVIYLLIKCINYTKGDNLEESEKTKDYNPTEEMKSKEKVFFFIGLGLSIIVWLLNTMVG